MESTSFLLQILSYIFPLIWGEGGVIFKCHALKL